MIVTDLCPFQQQISFCKNSRVVTGTDRAPNIEQVTVAGWTRQGHQIWPKIYCFLAQILGPNYLFFAQIFYVFGPNYYFIGPNFIVFGPNYYVFGTYLT